MANGFSISSCHFLETPQGYVSLPKLIDEIEKREKSKSREDLTILLASCNERGIKIKDEGGATIIFRTGKAGCYRATGEICISSPEQPKSGR